MTNTAFFKGLPDFDSPTSTETVADSDRSNLLKLALLLEEFNWHEKMAIGLIAYHSIDGTHRNLVKIAPGHGEYSVPVQQALEFIKRLSPQALAELAADILEEDFKGEIEVKNEEAN
jgi:hypothetical protein